MSNAEPVLDPESSDGHEWLLSCAVASARSLRATPVRRMNPATRMVIRLLDQKTRQAKLQAAQRPQLSGLKGGRDSSAEPTHVQAPLVFGVERPSD